MKKLLLLLVLALTIVSASAQGFAEWKVYVNTNYTTLRDTPEDGSITNFIMEIPRFTELTVIDDHLYNNYIWCEYDYKDSLIMGFIKREDIFPPTMKFVNGEEMKESYYAAMEQRDGRVFAGLDYIALNEHSLIGIRAGYVDDKHFIDLTAGYGKLSKDNVIVDTYTYGFDLGFRFLPRFYAGSGLHYYSIRVETSNNFYHNIDILAIPINLLISEERFGFNVSMSIPIVEGKGLVDNYSIATIGLIYKF